MNYDVLNNIIDAYIRRNGQQAITGEVLNGVLDMMVSELGSGYQFGGVVAPSTPFEGGDSRLFFLACEEGVYPSFGGIEVAKGQLAVITYDTEFNAQYIEGLGGGGGVFVAQYGVTTLAEVQSAFAEGLPVFAIRGNALYTLSNSAGADGAYFARMQGTTLYYLTLGESWYFGTIVLPTADEVADMVKFTPQTLTPAQQLQARNNIDAASKAQVTRIALNVGFTDKIKDTATTMRELSERVSIINVIDGDKIAGCILPSSQSGTIGWLYEFEEGWMLTKDISDYVIGEHTWEDLLWYLDANSGKIVNAIRLGLVTGDLSTLTTEDKSTLVAAINEVNADKASSAALAAEVTRATAAEDALSGEIGNLSSLTTTDKSNLVNAINEVAQGGGGEWEFIKDIVITEPVHSVSDSLGGEYKELFITFDTALLIVNASGTGVADKFYFFSRLSEGVYGQMLQSAQTPVGAYPRAAYMWVRQFGNFRVMTSCVNATVAGAQYTYDCYAVVPALNHTFTEVHISVFNSANNINANTIHIFGKR